ncbi:lamin tail domain-containing protein [Amorphoplanes digitatis]|uniref:Endonuclease YncB(Thermonuclease family) n=1 Tax=Actinoplanes digitatis TaxID=1868 RepID=A0A7W7MRL3_9ACTN|nr:lamin tail domain-containing protein [Actinoplanes digitatis]MBB4763730.1 endonuclease YncB(thermonuclease family) [Actinoplanes digitatis]GID93013.1 hypothetical protein Adi01nite_24250 [Actinoplanes digitatis]
MRRRLAALAAAVTVAGGLAVMPTTPAVAASVPCLPGSGGPACQTWTGRVIAVNDGDTLSIDIAGDGTSTPRSIRLINVQAMEQTVYSSIPSRRRGECNSLAATARVEQLVRSGGGVVRLTAQHASSSSRSRSLRSISVKINGVWRDIGLDLLGRGLALWQPFAAEWAWNAQYRAAEQRAAHARTGLFDTDSCGTGPAQSVPIEVIVNYDAPGRDEDNVNGEWVQVTNHRATPLAIGNWWIRDSGLRRYTFPAGTTVPAQGTIQLHVGKGKSTPTRKYWGLTTPIFDNPTSDQEAHGDGAYLFDPQGDLRAWMLYPCVLNCTAPA